MNRTAFILFFILVFSGSSKIHADTLTVGNIAIEGNVHTKENYILRHLTIKSGQLLTPEQLQNEIDHSEKQLFNTSLFLEVNINTQINRQAVDILVRVKERWYFFAAPVVELADRSFNEWWVDHGHRLNRVDFGLNLQYKNMWGRNERLTVASQSGYSTVFGLEYQIPYLNKKQNSGLSALFLYDRNFEVAYGISSTNKLQYVRSHTMQRQRIITELSYTYSSNVRIKYSLDAGYKYVQIQDGLAKLNPDYLATDYTWQKWFLINYRFEANFLDRYFYPLNGYLIEFSLSKQGLGVFNDVNYWQTNAGMAFFHPLSNRFSYGGGFKVNWSNTDYYFLGSPALGYRKNYLRSFEYYLISGKSTILNRNEVKFEWIKKNVKLNILENAEKFNPVPVELYLKAWFDQGYCQGAANSSYMLTDKWLYSFGLGVDFVCYYDIVIRLEPGINSLGEAGVFLNFQKGI